MDTIDVYGYDPLLADEMIEKFGVTSLPGLDQKMDAMGISGWA